MNPREEVIELKTPTVRLATLVAGVLALDSLSHVYWATGAVWPASDEQSLSEAVLGSEVPFTPSVVLPLATLLLGAALTVLGRARLGREHRFGELLHYGTLAVAAGVSMRASAGLVWLFGIGSEIGTPFWWLNLTVYTPLCLALAIATLLVASDGAQRGTMREPEERAGFRRATNQLRART